MSQQAGSQLLQISNSPNRTLTLHSGIITSWRINAEALSDEFIENLAAHIGPILYFNALHSIPRGGDRMTAALEPYLRPIKAGHPIVHLIVDDVLTTGASLKTEKHRLQTEEFIDPLWINGFVIFDRSEPEVSAQLSGWVHSAFRIQSASHLLL